MYFHTILRIPSYLRGEYKIGVDIMKMVLVNVYKYGELSETAKIKVNEQVSSLMLDTGILTSVVQLEVLSLFPGASDIKYSLGYCQGDGVSFTGNWEDKESLCAVLDAMHTFKYTLPEMAEEKLRNDPDTFFTLKRNSLQYVHKDTVTVHLENDLPDEIANEAIDVLQAYFSHVCRIAEITGYAEIESWNGENFVAYFVRDWSFYADGSVANYNEDWEE